MQELFDEIVRLEREMAKANDHQDEARAVYHTAHEAAWVVYGRLSEARRRLGKAIRAASDVDPHEPKKIDWPGQDDKPGLPFDVRIALPEM